MVVRDFLQSGTLITEDAEDPLLTNALLRYLNTVVSRHGHSAKLGGTKTLL